MNQIGYCCINLSLEEQKITSNRGMVKKTFLSKGLSYVGELALKNLFDLEKILKWNIDNDIKVFRMSSNIFPWMTEYEFKDIPNFSEIKNQLELIGKLIKNNNIRVSFHPGPYNQLASESNKVLLSTHNDLLKHAQIFEYMGLEGFQYPINIHIGGTYGNKKESLNRAIQNFRNLPNIVKSRLILENDDKESGYHILDLYKFYQENGTPICFDFHHHKCSIPQFDIFEALKIYSKTWDKDIIPLAHFSSSRKIEDEKAIERSHADYIYERINTFGFNLDIELECKKKDIALLKYRKDYNYYK